MRKHDEVLETDTLDTLLLQPIPLSVISMTLPGGLYMHELRMREV